ncbi:MAG: reductase [Oscillospiraceae bacterium]|nr:reductase [Oscillospiraceae bacterium]
MKILVAGGTRFFGIPMVKSLIKDGFDVTVATRGKTEDPFGDSVSRIIYDRHDESSTASAMKGRSFDIVIDKIAYCSQDVELLSKYLSCGRYILMSSAAVYKPMRANTPESDFNAGNYGYRLCRREDSDYGEVKRQAECAAFRTFGESGYTAVRYPVVMGKHDYTGRLQFYVSHIVNGIPMFVDDLDCEISFIEENEAGNFLEFLVSHKVAGPVNGCSLSGISIRSIIDFIEKRTNKKAVLSDSGDAAPYNGYEAHSTLSTEIAENAGYKFSNINDWIFRLIDFYLNEL